MDYAESELELQNFVKLTSLQHIFIAYVCLVHVEVKEDPNQVLVNHELGNLGAVRGEAPNGHGSILLDCSGVVGEQVPEKDHDPHLNHLLSILSLLAELGTLLGKRVPLNSILLEGCNSQKKKSNN